MLETRYTWIIPKGLQQASIATSDNPDAPQGVKNMFRVPLSKTGNEPVTHYLSSGLMSEEQVAYLDAELPGPIPNTIYLDDIIAATPPGQQPNIPPLGSAIRKVVCYDVWTALRAWDLKIINPPNLP